MNEAHFFSANDLTSGPWVVTKLRLDTDVTYTLFGDLWEDSLGTAVECIRMRCSLLSEEARNTECQWRKNVSRGILSFPRNNCEGFVKFE